ncbi:MAG: carboxypeptidase regulatory-like domain-containing protein [Planctomycetia bacterium]|nr:carboxypeptidase regulatory-like domain-containing protein [Planctomycetia bacterium]
MSSRQHDGRPSLLGHAAAVLAACLVAGCGRAGSPPLGIVSGVVTLDGVPLPDATVLFTPLGPGRTSRGCTDAAGRYELSYLRELRGANVDRHVVRITTASEDRRGPERLPPRYHVRTELEATVVAGVNRLDFPLQSRDR